MRKFWVSLATLLMTCPAISGQTKGGPSRPNQRLTLDDVMNRWERSMRGVNSLSALVVRTTLDKTFQSTEVFEGSAKYMRPNLARVDLYKKNSPSQFERIIFSGSALYVYVPKERRIRVYDLPNSKGGKVPDDNFLTFLFGGMKAVDAKKKYDLSLLRSPANDKWYHYVMIRPKTREDKADFTKARLVLSNATSLPRQLWFVQPNGNEITLDFPRVVNGKDLSGRAIQRTDFGKPKLDRGWQYDYQKSPRVARPKSK